MTVRDLLLARIADGKAAEAALADLEAKAEGWLEREVDAVKAFFANVKDHLGL